MILFYKKITSLIGKLRLVSTHDALVVIVWEYETPHRVKLDAMIEDEKQPILLQTEKKLMEYLAGERTSFDIPLKLVGSEFQRNVRQTLQEIPYGTTVSYGEIAARIAKPLAVRAVGTAIGKNPISIIIPCHRVIGKNGCSLCFSGKLHVKKTLLELEGVEGWETGASLA